MPRRLDGFEVVEGLPTGVTDVGEVVKSGLVLGGASGALSGGAKGAEEGEAVCER